MTMAWDGLKRFFGGGDVKKDTNPEIKWLEASETRVTYHRSRQPAWTAQ
jgi:hypothetical protein